MSEKLFPIQAPEGHYPETLIPWWLAEIAYEHYHKHFPDHSLEKVAERGGFSREELVAYIRREMPGRSEYELTEGKVKKGGVNKRPKGPPPPPPKGQGSR